MLDITPAQTSQGLVVGFSGGLDSTVLLNWLAQQPMIRQIGLRAIHIDHGLHPDSKKWAVHCAKFCDQLNVPLVIEQVQINRDAGLGTEAAARQVRYAAFAKHLDDNQWLTLAHHQDDQAETLLLRLLRSAGGDGLTGMRKLRAFASGKLWRPLLDTSRQQLIDYAKRHQLHWIDDPSNDSNAFDRNYLRHQVLPVLVQRWPHASKALARSSTLLAEQNDALIALDMANLRECKNNDDPRCLNWGRLLALPAAWQSRVLRYWVSQLGLPPLPATGVKTILQDFDKAASDRQPQFHWSGAFIERWNDLLHAQWLEKSVDLTWSVSWTGADPLMLPSGDQIELQSTGGLPKALTVCWRRGGERIYLPNRQHTHALKDVLHDLAIPPWLRRRLPLLIDQDNMVLAAGDRVFSAEFSHWLDAHQAKLRWIIDLHK